MQALVYTKYGPPEVLQLKEIAKPVPKADEILIRIQATAVNDFDWSLVSGKPYPYRLMFGLLKPKRPTPGIELAGTVEALGEQVTSFKVGDAVYGDISAYGWGSFAEYICVPEKAMTIKPANLSFAEAASIPHASMLAMQGLIDVGNIQQGQKILINGAGGGVGTFGLQIAKLYDAEVTGVDNGDKLEMMQTLGFDQVIDYKKEDFTTSGQRYDLILDAKSNRPMSAYAKALTPQGKYVTVGGDLTRLLQLVALRGLGKKNFHLVNLKQNKDLVLINELFAVGKIKPVIDGPYPLSDGAKMLRYFGEGKHQGKVILQV